ncbi:hypothetical protein ACJVQT_23130 [Enterobacter huaxiensis]|uniref:hypothetical protein n=1 Tax=Enterobacter huaxiensis TaxID=2494702 RepID=UPI002175E18A|nr:hypothetical protein [Enterobacter huaxiensis]MCS5452472.1 hypothetical protein [Enterobacter huaxiensis]
MKNLIIAMNLALAAVPVIALSDTMCTHIAKFQYELFSDHANLTYSRQFQYEDNLFNACTFGETAAMRGDDFYSMLDFVIRWYTVGLQAPPDSQKGLLASAVNGFFYTQDLIGKDKQY